MIFFSLRLGSVNHCKPYGENVYVYDVNYLFSSRMYEYSMSVSNPLYFKGNISFN